MLGLGLDPIYRYTQIGVVSFGNECANPDFPGVYARLTEVINWIRDVAKSTDYIGVKPLHSNCENWFLSGYLYIIQLYDATQRWLVLGGTIVKKQHLLKTLVTWGPTFKISLKLFINSFVGHNLQNGNLAEVLRFTTTDNDCCAIGDRIPAIFTHRRGFLQVATHIGADGNKKKNFRLDEKTWYTLEIKQYRKNNKVS